MKVPLSLTCVDMSSVYALRQMHKGGSLSVTLVDSGKRDEERMSRESHKPSCSQHHSQHQQGTRPAEQRIAVEKKKERRGEERENLSAVSLPLMLWS